MKHELVELVVQLFRDDWLCVRTMVDMN